MRKFLVAVVLVLLSCTVALAATPKVWYNTDGETVWREGKKGREETGIEPYVVTGSDYYWFEADSAVWLSNPENDGHAPIYLPVKKGEICQDVELAPRQNAVFLCLTTAQKETIAMFDFDGKRLAETPGVIGMGGHTLSWLDDYRFLFTTSVPGTKRGRESGCWHGAAVFEIFGTPGGDYFETLVTPLVEPTATVDYRAYSVDGDECVILKNTVRSPKEWEELDDGAEEVGESEEIRVPVPAAG